MDAIEFPEQTVIIAKDQPEYKPLPAHVGTVEGWGITVTFCYRLTFRERVRLLFTGKLWHSVLTFGRALQPQLMNTQKPDFVIKQDEI